MRAQFTSRWVQSHIRTYARCFHVSSSLCASFSPLGMLSSTPTCTPNHSYRLSTQCRYTSPWSHAWLLKGVRILPACLLHRIWTWTAPPDFGLRQTYPFSFSFSFALPLPIPIPPQIPSSSRTHFADVRRNCRNAYVVAQGRACCA